MRAIILAILLLPLSAEAQSRFNDGLFLKTADFGSQVREPMLTGVLSEDLFAAQPTPAVKESLDVVETKSALTAGGLSLLVPGAGQIYSKDYWVGAGFLALEAAAWAVDFIWTTKGNNQESFYMRYADGTAADNYQNAHYSVVRYAQWIKNNYVALEQYNGTTTQGQQVISNWVGQLLPNTVNATAAPWTQVNWYALNQIEGAMGGYFTHQLFPHGNFEYYELIGKYPQFRQGWGDSPYALWLKNGEQGSPPIAYNEADTPNSSYYMDARGKANSLFRVATDAIEFVILNHFASALEAAIAAHVHNKAVQAHVALTPLPMGMGYQTQVQLAVNF